MELCGQNYFIKFKGVLMKQFKVVSLYLFLIVNLFSSLGVNAKSIVAGDIVEGQQYVPNFLKQKGHFEKNANGTSAYADAAGTRPVDGTGGAPTLTCTRTTSSPIDGDGSLLITKDAANRQGEGCTIQFTIDSAYKAKVLQIEFDYLVASGTFTAGSSSADSDLIAYIYDVTNSTLIEPSSIKLLSNSTTIADHFVANFQTSATGTTYNLILHQATTSASAYTVNTDNFQVKPSQYVYGTPITDWVAYTPTFGAGFGTVAVSAFYSRRVGDSLEVKGKWTNGTVAANTASISVGYGGGNANVTIDTTKVSINSIIGSAQTSLASTTQFAVFPIAPASNATTIGFTLQNSTTGFGSGAQLGSSISATGSQNAVAFSVPIVGWSSSVQVSDGYDGRSIVFVGKNSASTSIATTGTYIPFTSQKDSTASWSTDTFTCPSAGDYEVIAGLHGSSASNYFYAQVDKNGTIFARILQNESRGDRLASGSVIVHNCAAGDTIKLKGFSDTASQTLNSSADLNFITIKKLQSPTTISATEVVAFDANTSTTVGSTSTPLLFTVINDNSHGAYSSATGKFTAPYPGIYHFSAGAYFGATTASARLYKNGTYIRQGNQSSLTSVSVLSSELKLITGDTVEVRPDASATANGAPEINYFSGFRIK